MIEINGQYTSAKVLTDNLEAGARTQIETLTNLPLSEGSTIRVMPEVHQGKGCTIGLTHRVQKVDGGDLHHFGDAGHDRRESDSL